MKSKIVTSVVISALLFSCDISGVKTTDEALEEIEVSNNPDTISSLELTNEDSNRGDSQESKVASEVLENPETIEYDNGVIITWKSKGKGESISKNDLVDIDYMVSLEDGGVYDGNHLIKKNAIPFMVGWNMQTEGWDFAFQKLTEGDDVEIFLPAKLARGEKGIPGLVPPNSNNIISARILGVKQPTIEVDGIRVWKVESGKNAKDTIGYGDIVRFHYMVSSESKPRYDNSYQRREEFEYVMGEDNVIPGLYKALHYGRKGDKLMIHIPASEAFGTKGLKGLVKPNEDIFYDVLITGLEKATSKEE